MQIYPETKLERFLAKDNRIDLPALMKLETFLAKLQLDPKPPSQQLIELKEDWETVLNLIEQLFLESIMSGNWAELEEFIASCKENDHANG